MPLILTDCLGAAEKAGLINPKQHKAMLADAQKRITNGMDERAAGQSVINEFAHKAGEKLHTDLNKLKSSLKIPTEEFKPFETKGKPEEITAKFNEQKQELVTPKKEENASSIESPTKVGEQPIGTQSIGGTGSEGMGRSEQGTEPTGKEKPIEEKNINKGEEEKVGRFEAKARKIADEIAGANAATLILSTKKKLAWFYAIQLTLFFTIFVLGVFKFS